MRKIAKAAHRFAPDDPAPLEELGHIDDVVMTDRAEAERYGLAALAMGLGRRARKALADLLQETAGRWRCQPVTASPHPSRAKPC